MLTGHFHSRSVMDMDMEDQRREEDFDLAVIGTYAFDMVMVRNRQLTITLQ